MRNLLLSFFLIGSVALAGPYGRGPGVTPGGSGGSGISSLNGLTDSLQTFETGTSGTDFAISSGSGIHTFNIPTASSSNRGLLSSSDWSTFNGKQASGNYITALTGDVSASGPGSASATISSTTVTGKVLTGFSSGAGTVASTDTILQAINKIVGNLALKAPLASPSFTGTIGTPLTASRGVVTDGSGNLSVASGNLSGTNSGDVTIGTANGLSLVGQALSLQAATDSVPGAMSATDHTAFTGLKVEQLDGQVTTPANNDVYYIRPYVFYAGTLNSIYLKCGSGSITANVKINSTSVTSLSAVSVTTTGAVTASSGANTAAVADVLSITVTSNSSCTPLIWSAKYTRS